MINDSNDNIDHMILLNTQLNCYNNLSKIMNLILKNLNIYIDNISIFNFSLKVNNYTGKIKIYAYVDLYSKTLKNDMKFINVEEIYNNNIEIKIKTKEYIHPLSNEYKLLVDKYIKIPSYIKLLGKTITKSYLNILINLKFNSLSRNIKKSITKYIIDNN